MHDERNINLSCDEIRKEPTAELLTAGMAR